jgi:hypothetical protein
MILVKSYDCAKRLRHEDSTERILVDSTVLRADLSKDPRWYPAPENPAADPTLDFVCA